MSEGALAAPGRNRPPSGSELDVLPPHAPKSSRLTRSLLMHAVDRVREVMEEGGTLADAADALRQNITAGDMESWPLEPGRTDVVRVMNLHKAKGLEAPVVFLADPCGGFESEAEIRIDRQDTGAVGYMRIVRKHPEWHSVVIDLAYRSDEEWRVVDYKTDQLPERGTADLLARYAVQLESCRHAWVELTGERSVRVGVHAVRAGEAVWREWALAASPERRPEHRA